MIFNETIKKKYFVLDKQTIIDKYENRLKYISETKIVPKDDEVVYYDYKMLMFPFLQEDGTLREATDRELIEKGICSLAENQVLVGDTAKMIYEFPIPENIAKPVFNKETLEWEESANSEEKATFWKDKCKLISSEMIVLERAGLEGDSEYVKLQIRLEDCKEKYMTASHEMALEMDKVF